MKITVSAIKADIGGIGGHTKPSEELVQEVKRFVNSNAKDLLIDHYIWLHRRCLSVIFYL